MVTKTIKDEIFYLIKNEIDMTNYLLNKNSKNYSTKRNYLLTNDIDWNKIEKIYQNPINDFTGKFYGNNFKIENIKINSEYENSYIGFFSFLNNSIIDNLNLHFNTTIKGNNFIGALAGIIIGSILGVAALGGFYFYCIKGSESGSDGGARREMVPLKV